MIEPSSLALCPFCGSKAEYYPPSCRERDEYNPLDRAFPIVRCTACGAQTEGENWDHSGRSAVKRWNLRIQQSQPTKEGD
jgi:hypothetical protein